MRVLLAIALSALLAGCDHEPEACELRERTLDVHRTSQLGFSFAEARAARRAHVTVAGATYDLDIEFHGGVREVMATAKEPSSFSGTWACTSHLASYASVKVSSANGAVDGNFPVGEIRVFSPSWYLIWVKSSPSVLTSEELASQDGEVTLIVEVRDGTATATAVFDAVRSGPADNSDGGAEQGEAIGIIESASVVLEEPSQ